MKNFTTYLRYARLAALTMFITLGFGQIWGDGGIGYKGVKFTKNGTATEWYNIHNVSWNYYNSTYDCRSGQSGVTDFNNANLGIVTTLKLKAFVVIGWTDGSDYVAGQLKYRLYKQSASAGSYSTYNVGNYGSTSTTSSAANVLVSSGNDRVVGKASLSTDIVTSSTAPGVYYLQLQGLGRMQWANNGKYGSFNDNNGSEVKASLTVPGFETTSTSHAFGSVDVGSNSSTTKSFTKHYGTTLTTSNCSITGTNSSDFSVTAISETGVTIRFAPSSAGSKSATLTITDAHSKTCTITLTGTGTATTTPSVTLAVSKSSGVQIGETVTLTATPSNATSPTYRYRMKKSTETAGAWQTSKSFVIPSHGTFYFEVEMTSGGTKYYNNGGTASTVPTNVSLSTTEPALSGSATATVQIGGTASMALTNATYTTNTATIKHSSNTPNTSYTLGNNYTFTKTGTWTFTATAAYGSTYSKTITKTVTVSTPTISGVSDSNVAPGGTVTLSPTYTNADNCTKTITVTTPASVSSSYTAGSSYTCSEEGTYTFVISVKYSGTEVATKTVTITAAPAPIIYVLKSQSAQSSITGFSAAEPYGLWAWGDAGNFYQNVTWNTRKTSDTAPTYTDETGNVWYKFESDNLTGADEYHFLILSSNTDGDANRIVQTEWMSSGTPGHVDGVNQTSPRKFSGTVWVVPHGAVKLGAYIYTTYPDCAKPTLTLNKTGTSGSPYALTMSTTGTTTLSITATTTATAANTSWAVKTSSGAATSGASISPTSGNKSATLTVTTAGTYKVTCTTTNACGTTTQDLYVKATCATPTITAGTTTLNIKASGTTTVGPTAVNNASTYAWTIVSGTEGSFSNASVRNPTFTPKAATAQQYKLRLTASNACGQSKTQDYIINVCHNATFSDNAGFTRDVNLNNTLSVSLDPTVTNGGSTYAWTKQSGPAGGSFSSTNTKATTFSFTTAGNYVLRLTVNGAGACSSDSYYQDYTITVSGEMPKVTLHVKDESVSTQWSGATTIYAYYWKSASVNGFVALTWNSTNRYWAGDIPKNVAELGYRLYICKTQSVSAAVRTYDANEYGYVDLPADSYTTHTLEITPCLDSNNQRFGLRAQCASFTLNDASFSIGDNASLTLGVTKKADSPNPLPTGATYLWQCIQGTDGDDLLANATTATPIFYKTRNGHNANGRYVYQVTVTNPNNSDCFATALISVDAFTGTYYLKHAKSANNSNWGWDNMTHQGNGIYTVSAYYDGNASNAGAKVSQDKKIRINAKIGDVCNNQVFERPTLYWWNGSTSGDYYCAEASALDGYQFYVPEDYTNFTIESANYSSSNNTTNSHKSENYVSGAADDLYFYLYSNVSDKGSDACYTSYLTYSAVDYPEGYVRYDGYRNKDNILGHEHAAGTVIWVYNAVTDELSIQESGTYYRLAATVPSGTSYSFAGTAGKTYYSNGVKTIGTGDASKVSLYVAAGAEVKLQKSTNGVSYTDVSPAVAFAGPTQDGVWVTHISSTTNGATLTWTRYTGDYYLRSKGVLNDMANYKTNASAKMTAFEPDRTNVNEFFNHYWVNHLEHGENISAMVANDINPCLSDELGSYYVGTDNFQPNIRYAYDDLTNHFSYSLLNGSTAGLRFLTLFGGQHVYDNNTSGKSLLTQANPEELADQSNWVYVADIYAYDDATVRLLGQYKKDYSATPKQVWLLGNGDNLTTLQVLSNNIPDDIRHLLVTYDFKTNKIVVGWIPDGDNISDNVTIEGNLILRRTNNGDVKTFILGSGKTITGLQRAYFNFILTPYNASTARDGLKADQNLYWFSLPFDCKISDIFGIAGYGKDWIIQRYRGDARAYYSWLVSIPTFWNNITNPDFVLKAGEGYVMSFKAANIDFKEITVDGKTTSQNSIFFPSMYEIGNVTDQPTTATYEPMICTAQSGLRKSEDSNWRVIGPMTYEPTVQFSGYTADGEQISTSGKAYPNFLYVFTNPFQKSQGNNNPITAYTVQNGSTFTYKTTFGYMTQFAGTISWQSAAISSSGAGAPRRRAPQTNAGQHHESYTLMVGNNAVDTLDQTIVVLESGAESDFVPGEDLYKFAESDVNVIYTIASGKPAAGNALPYANQEVPVTVKTTEAGEVTFTLTGDIDGTTGVELIDMVENITTDLRQYSYSASVAAGEVSNRFKLLFTINAGQHGGTTTAIDEMSGENPDIRIEEGRIIVQTKEREAMNNDIRLFDAAGRLVAYEQGAKTQESGVKTHESGTKTWTSPALPQGVYMLRIGNTTRKVVL